MHIKITGIFVWITVMIIALLFLKFLRWGHSQHVKERKVLSLFTAEQAKRMCEIEKDNSRTRQLSNVLSWIRERSMNGYSRFEIGNLYDENVSKLIDLGYKVNELKDDTMITVKYVISWNEDD